MRIHLRKKINIGTLKQKKKLESFRNRKKILEISCSRFGFTSLLGENLHRKQKGGRGVCFPPLHFSLIRMRSRYPAPAFIPLTLSTSVAFQFRTCRAVSLVAEGGFNNFRRSGAILDGNFIGGSPGLKIPRASPIFHTFIWQFGKLRSTPSSPPECLTRIDFSLPTDQRKTVELFIFFVGRDRGSKVNLRG